MSGFVLKGALVEFMPTFLPVPVPNVIDEVGCGLGCACMERKGRDIIVAREEAIYLCGIEGRGSCYAYEGRFRFRI